MITSLLNNFQILLNNFECFMWFPIVDFHLGIVVLSEHISHC